MKKFYYTYLIKYLFKKEKYFISLEELHSEKSTVQSYNWL